LRFHADDVCLDRRAHHAERNSFGNGDDEQSALGVSDGRNRRNVFNDAEEVRTLHEDRRSFFRDGLL
jgi:hypothetical protein